MYKLNLLKKIPEIGMAQHVSSNGIMYGTHNRDIFKYDQQGAVIIGQFPRTYPRDLVAISRIMSRALRTDKSNFYINSHGKMIGIRGSLVYSIEQKSATPLFKIQGDCVLHRGICEAHDGWLYFGEYFVNTERTEVNIFRVSPDLKSWEVAMQFEPGKIRHVHNIFRDPFDYKSLWVTVGDYQDECFILRTKDQFKSIEYFGDGNQMWRAVSLYFTKSHVNWITDSHLEQNYALRMDRKTGQVERGQKFACSNWYGCTTKQGMHIAFTTVEKGEAIKRQESSIYVSKDAFKWYEIYAFKKDKYKPYSIFKNGVICCPSGENDLNNFYISGEGLVGFDGLTMNISIDPEDSL